LAFQPTLVCSPAWHAWHGEGGNHFCQVVMQEVFVDHCKQGVDIMENTFGVKWIIQVHVFEMLKGMNFCGLLSVSGFQDSMETMQFSSEWNKCKFMCPLCNMDSEKRHISMRPSSRNLFSSQSASSSPPPPETSSSSSPPPPPTTSPTLPPPSSGRPRRSTKPNPKYDPQVYDLDLVSFSDKI
jgi:hypothetical protein